MELFTDRELCQHVMRPNASNAIIELFLNKATYITINKCKHKKRKFFAVFVQSPLERKLGGSRLYLLDRR